MRTAIAAAVLCACPLSYGHAAFTDFSDYGQTTSFGLGDVFPSQDLSFKAVSIEPISNPVRIFANANQGSAFLLPGPGVEFLLPPGVQEITLFYSVGSSSAIAINGVEPSPYPGQGGTPYHAGFSYLNGKSLAGVDVTTTTSFSAVHGEEGVLTLHGPINSLVVAGLELLIDNVRVQVPEPSAAALLAFGAFGIWRRSRCRRS